MPHDYPPQDLEAMAFAMRYHAWIRDEFAPVVRGDVVEVGAGDGRFSRLLLQLSPDSLTLFEPSPVLFARQVQQVGQDARVRRHATTFTAAPASFDTAVYVNVLEHIEDDVGALARVHAALRPGGHLCLFVPAMPALMSAYDRSIGHYRRYRRRELQQRVEAAGFHVLSLVHFDLPGAPLWWLTMRLLQLRLRPESVALYDRLAVPPLRWLETRWRPPFGKNLLLVARRG
jgi:SAM-dependent methyltransferase